MRNEQLNFVQQKIDEDINLFTGRRNYNRNAAFRFGIVFSALSALTTILIGTSEIVEVPWLRIVALVTSGFVTIVGAWEGLFQNRKLWTLSNSIMADLYELKMDIDFRLADIAHPTQQAEVEEFYSRYKKIARTAEEALKAIRSA